MNGFELLCEELGERYDDILDYFEDTYIGMSRTDFREKSVFLLIIGKLRSNRVRRKPTFDIDFWSMHHHTTQSSMRTNNSAEAYHRRINSVFQCAHPTLWVFLKKLIDEESAVHADLVQINERLERHLLNLLTSSQGQILEQLDSIAHKIIF